MIKSVCEVRITSAVLASGKKTRQVPYGAMKKDIAAFVPAECLPTGTVISDPRNMNLDDIRNVLQHCYTRQVNVNAESAFRFLVVIGPKRKHVHVNSPGSNGDELNSRKERRKKKGKGKELADPFVGLLKINPDPTTTVGTEHPLIGSSDQIQSRQLPTRLVRINMGVMVQLKEMGYPVSGPINGPNEGLPEFEVPEEWLNSLASETPAMPSEVGCAPDPRPKPIPPTDDQIDPLLRVHKPDELLGRLPPRQSPLTQATTPPNSPTESTANQESILPEFDNPEVDVSADRDIPPNVENPEITPNRASGSLGRKRNRQFSPRKTRQANPKTKRKKVTDDDRAVDEAEALGELGKRQRRKPSRLL